MTSPSPVSADRSYPALTDLEILANRPLGLEPQPFDIPASRGISIRDALEEAVVPSLAAGPCFVSFSGGRDSSAVLAIATHVARRHGLADPVPVSQRFPGAPTTEETEWQQIVVEHLGIKEHVLVELDDELDTLGAVATSVLQRHGVRWPGNGYMHAPMFDVARGGSLLTGVGGDELFGTTASRFVLAAHRRVPFDRAALVSLAYASMPRPAREHVWRRTRSPSHTWLTERGRARVDRALARDDTAYPRRWDRALVHWHQTRSFSCVQQTLPYLGRDWDVAVVNPLISENVLAEMLATGRATGFTSRSEAMLELFGDLLPESLLTRPTKASFGAPVWGPAARAFAAEWDGSSIDERDVDREALRREWLEPEPNFNSILLLQRAWLEAQAATDQGSARSS